MPRNSSRKKNARKRPDEQHDKVAHEESSSSVNKPQKKKLRGHGPSTKAKPTVIANPKCVRRPLDKVTMQTLDIVLHQWLSAKAVTRMVSPKIVLVEMHGDREEERLASKLRVEAFGSGATVLAKFFFDEETKLMQLLVAIGRKCGAAGSFRLLLNGRELIASESTLYSLGVVDGSVLSTLNANDRWLSTGWLSIAFCRAVVVPCPIANVNVCVPLV